MAKDTKFQNLDIMSDKEKKYVSNFIFRDLGKGIIDYCKIMKEERFEIKEKETQKGLQSLFGKQIKRSKKWFRESASVDVSKEVKTKIFFASANFTLTILRRVEISAKTHKELESDLITNMISNLSEIILDKSNVDVIMKILREMHTSFSKKGEIFTCFLVKFLQLIETDEEFFAELSKFLDDCLDCEYSIRPKYTDINDYKDLLIQSSGVALGCFLILKNNEFVDIFGTLILKNRRICKKCKHFKNFILLIENFTKNVEVKKACREIINKK